MACVIAPAAWRYSLRSAAPHHRATWLRVFISKAAATCGLARKVHTTITKTPAWGRHLFWSDPEQVRRPACRPIAACRGRTQSRRSYAWAGGFAVKSNHFGLRACRLVKSHAAAPAAWRYSPQSFAPHPSSATSPLIAALGGNSGDCASSLTPSSPRNSIPCSSKTCRVAWRFRTCIEGVPLTRSPRVIADCEMPHLRTDHFSNARAARIVLR